MGRSLKEAGPLFSHDTQDQEEGRWPLVGRADPSTPPAGSGPDADNHAPAPRPSGEGPDDAEDDDTVSAPSRK